MFTMKLRSVYCGFTVHARTVSSAAHFQWRWRWRQRRSHRNDLWYPSMKVVMWLHNNGVAALYVSAVGKRNSLANLVFVRCKNFIENAAEFFNSMAFWLLFYAVFHSLLAIDATRMWMYLHLTKLCYRSPSLGLHRKDILRRKNAS